MIFLQRIAEETFSDSYMHFFLELLFASLPPLSSEVESKIPQVVVPSWTVAPCAAECTWAWGSDEFGVRKWGQDTARLRGEAVPEAVLVL